MSHNLSNLFTGGKNKPTFEFVSKQVGPFSGRRMSIKSHDAVAIGNFQERMEKPIEKPANPLNCPIIQLWRETNEQLAC